MQEQSSRAALVLSEDYLEHKPGHTHPEHPNRLVSIHRMIDSCFKEVFPVITPALATLEQLELVHTPTYIKKVMKTAEQPSTSLAPDTPASSRTYHCAWLAVGGCIKALDCLLSGEFDSCFALVRPPGHHAQRDRAGGFCVFNNLAVAARYAVKRRGIEHVLIIDWDIHHGNGIQDFFYGDRSVFYFSTHDPLLYPYTGTFEETGEDDGAGYNLNIQIPRDLSDGEFLFIYGEVLRPLLLRYQPQLILAAAGFDAHKEDPIGRSRLSAGVFGALTGMLLNLIKECGNPPILFSLEGGYNPQALADSVKESLKTMTGVYQRDEVKIEATDRVMDIAARARDCHKKFGIWTD